MSSIASRYLFIIQFNVSYKDGFRLEYTIMSKIRLNKYLASVGIASRRKIDQLTTDGRIKINGAIAKLGQMIDPERDQILIDNEKIKPEEQLVYIILNKPKGVISTSNDELGRESVTSMVRSNIRVYPVGRLDETSTGLILLTNDGELAYKLTHPKFHIPKTYELLIQGTVSDEILQKLREGVLLKEGKTAPAAVKFLKEWDNRTLLEVTIHQGWHHQIRRMCSKVGIELIGLKRIAFGSIKLENLPEGKSRSLTAEEIAALRQ